MQILQRLRNVLILKNTITQSTTISAATATTDSASFHSSNLLFEKWKNKFNFDVRGEWKQSKSNIRYTVRQKRSDAKKALDGILFNGGSSTRSAESFRKIEADYTDRVNKKSRLTPAQRSKKVFNKKLKRKHQRERLSEDFDDDPEKLYYATFGKQGFRLSRKGFDWTENSGWSSYTFDEHDAKSRRESHQKSFVPGTYADRKVLGLPTAGLLRIEDVKAAFRSSALKWHPDRHQGSSQAAAEEKFKQCVDAYKSLCSTLSSP